MERTTYPRLFRRMLHPTPTSRAAWGRPRAGALSLGLIGATLVLTGLLAYQAIDSARSHRQTAENTLRDYAGMAAWEFARRSGELVSNVLHTTLGTVHNFDGRPPSTPLPTPTVLLPGIARRDITARALFRIDLTDESLLAVTPEGNPTSVPWLTDSIISRNPNRWGRMRRWRSFTRVNEATATTEVIAYHVVVDDRTRDRAVYGYISNARAFLHPVMVSCSREELLPKALARGQVTDSLLSLRVLGPLGESLYRSPVGYDTSFAATEALTAEHGDFRVQVAIRPDAADTFIIGGLPGSRIPLLVGLLLLTLGVGVALTLQIRRERQLALLRDDFVSGVSHELRTPLAQIRMFGELLDQGKLRTPSEEQRSTAVINREARRLSNLVENILTFSRLRRSPTGLTLEDTDLVQLIDDTLEAFQPLADARGVTVRRRIDAHLAIDADRDALSQILLNLLDNAVKYGPPDQTVTVALEPHQGAAVLAVEDEGPGVPVGSRDKIWSAYHRLERDANTTLVGSGIGLAVVAELAALLGGTARVEDANGGGARFLVTFPNAVVIRSADAATTRHSSVA